MDFPTATSQHTPSACIRKRAIYDGFTQATESPFAGNTGPLDGSFTLKDEIREHQRTQLSVMDPRLHENLYCSQKLPLLLVTEERQPLEIQPLPLLCLTFLCTIWSESRYFGAF